MSGLITSKITQLNNVNVEEAEANFLASKLALENVSDGKKKIEMTSQFKKARARFV